jgi:hypothetical protein
MRVVRWWPVLLAVLVAGPLVSCRSWPTRLRTNGTARRYVQAMNRADSTELARLSGSGSAQNSLCARRLWPAAFWIHNGKATVPKRAGQDGDDLRYQVIGDPLPGDTNRAVYSFLISPKRPDKILSIFADERQGVWTDEFRACLRP